MEKSGSGFFVEKILLYTKLVTDKKFLNNIEISELLRDIAAAYQLKDPGGARFKIIAYQRAADAVEHATSELKDLWDDGKLKEIPGVGASIAEHLSELFSTGRSKHFDELMEGLPKSMFEFMKVPGIGPKTAYKLAHDLSLKSLSDLEKAAKKGRIAELEGFGEQSQKDILDSIGTVRKRIKRHLLPYAMEISGRVIDYLLANKAVKKADTLGSLRRKVSTIGDIDIAAATEDPEKVLEYFTKFPNTQKILEKGTRTAAIILPGAVQVDLMVETPEAYGSLLQHFTGSKHHNIALRELALKKGFSLSDYGVKKVGSEKLIKFDGEEKLYNFFGLDFIPPEMREDTGEISVSMEHKLPKLVEIKDIKADLQIHSDFDVETSHDVGATSMEELVKKADEKGYEYIAFTDHNPSQKGHSAKDFVEILKKRRERIEKLNYSLKNMNIKNVQKVFNSLEIDIMPNGDLPVPQEALDELDFALVSIHSSFEGERNANTKRVLKALENPKVKIFAHPTGRKLNEREGVDLDWPEIFEFCLKRGKWIEINCDPMRLDLPDVLVREGVKLGVKFSLGTDSHHKDMMDNIPFGITVARRGWAEKKDIVNTLSYGDFCKAFAV